MVFPLALRTAAEAEGFGPASRSAAIIPGVTAVNGAKVKRRRTFAIRRSAIALRRNEEGESPRTIVIALLANLVIGVAKLLAGLATGSSAMLAEAAHSAADCVNEVFLAIGLYRARQPPDEAHPFGAYGARGLGCAEAQGVLDRVDFVVEGACPSRSRSGI
jgi:Co/Zn/Cd efflux system component